MRLLTFLLFPLWLSPVFGQKTRLEVRPVAPHGWVFTSYKILDGSPVPANGLIVEQGEKVFLVDCGWDEKSCRKLLRWVKRHLNKPVAAAFISHSHIDRSGGLGVLAREKIPIRMSKQTAGLLGKQGIAEPTYQEITEQDGNAFYQSFYPGEGHTPDNLVFYFPELHLLYGGCLVKSTEAPDLGYTGEANLAQWPESIRKVQQRFPEARIVVPGHQACGGPELLTHTLRLLETTPK